MDADVTLIRDLLSQVAAWDGASGEARRLAAVLWDELKDPGRVDADELDRVTGLLTGELRACRYERDRGIAPAVAELRGQVRRLADSQPRWESGHAAFAERTRRACRAAGLDL